MNTTEALRKGYRSGNRAGMLRTSFALMVVAAMHNEGWRRVTGLAVAAAILLAWAWYDVRFDRLVARVSRPE